MRNERKGRILGGALLAITLGLGAANLQAQEGRKVLSNPVPVYPEVARRLRLTGVVKVQVVIGADGSLTGYGGGMERKRWLLRHEGAAFKDTEPLLL